MKLLGTGPLNKTCDTCQWALHGLVIQGVVFHCALSVANDLTNAAMAPVKRKRHLTTSHSDMSSKSVDCLKWLLGSRNKQNKAFVNKVTDSGKTQDEIYLVAELIAQKGKCAQFLRTK
jgi:hypothetical protein